MRRAFTLVELMIVIAVIVSLMAITFRIMNTVGDTEARTITIMSSISVKAFFITTPRRKRKK